MASILTNSSAYVALETLRGINRDLAGVQSEISTGKKIASARDNSAIWAVATTIESDIGGFEQISDSLNLGTSSVGVARVASETITERLQDIKSRIVGAQEENVDRSKFQTEITELTEEITGIVNAAQFNGLNLIDGSAAADVSFLSSLDRDANGAVTASSISVARQDLSLSNTGTAQVLDSSTTNVADDDATYGTLAVSGGTGSTLTGSGAADSGGQIGTVGINSGAGEPANDGTATLTINSAGDGVGYQIVLADNGTGQANRLGERTFEYVSSATDSPAEVAASLAAQINNFFDATGETLYSAETDGADLVIRNSDTGTGNTLTVTASTFTGGNTAGETSGGLGDLVNIDVTTDAGATSALTAIEGLLTRSIDAAAEFGSSQSRLENQNEFVNQLTAALETGVGSLVDADLEAASAKLNALQVQQQLGTQALSIANQAPQQLLSLFR